MVTVLGHNGYLGSVVARRWRELGDSDHVVNCIFPDDIDLTWRYAEQGGLVQPSTDAIAEDTLYARTKRIIEKAPGAVIIRAGIVDIRRQPSVAYRNWQCNPLTPLEWADFAWQHRDEPWRHVTGRETVSRYDIAVHCADVFDTTPPLVAIDDIGLNRVQLTRDEYPPLREALIEFRDWLRAGAELERLAAGHG